MFERWNMEDLGEIAFIITPLVRHPVYKNPSLLNEWSGDVFNPILKAIKSHLMPTTTNRGAAGGSGSRPVSSISKRNEVATTIKGELNI